jgi:putative Holliday junction resolvase
VEKILGLDLGSRTCGIAMSDALGMIAHGVETFRFQENQYGAAAKRVKEIVEQNNIHTIVLGFPKHMNGDIGERAQISIDFKEKLEKMMDVKVVLVDERLSTVVAENQLIFANVKRKKRKQVIDKMAAVAILQGYLDSH